MVITKDYLLPTAKDGENFLLVEDKEIEKVPEPLKLFEYKVVPPLGVDFKEHTLVLPALEVVKLKVLKALASIIALV